MKLLLIITTGLLGLMATPSLALVLPEPAARAHWECVPFARFVSGVSIFGDAHTWWDQAEGHYRRGNRPRLGSVLSFKPHGRMRLGHVATVSDIIDARTVRVTHANWSPINGRRGQIERDVEVIDVSAGGDWTKVRVWFGPSAALGTTEWPTHGFIYPEGKIDQPGLQTVPKLEYGNVMQLDRPVKRPARRIAYLGAILATLK